MFVLNGDSSVGSQSQLSVSLVQVLSVFDFWQEEALVYHNGLCIAKMETQYNILHNGAFAIVRDPQYLNSFTVFVLQVDFGKSISLVIYEF